LNYLSFTAADIETLKVVDKKNEHGVFMLSVFVHFVIIGIVIFYTKDNLQNKHQQNDAVVLNSYLYKKKPVAPFPIKETQSEASTPKAQKFDGRTLNIQKNLANTESNSKPQTPAKLLIKNVEDNPSKPTKKIKDEIKPIDKPLIEIQRKPLKSTRKSLNNSSMIIRHNAQTINESAYENMLKQEVQSFNKQKNSPTIDTIGTMDTTIMPEKIAPSYVHCGGTVSKSLVMLSGLTGGNVQCKQYEIQSFIDKRLKKESEK